MNDEKNEGKINDKDLQIALTYVKEMRKEILARLKYSSTLFLEVLIISIALTEVAFIHGPASLLLLFPAILYYFLVLIWDQYIVIFSIGTYLRENIEYVLFSNSDLIQGWENYRSKNIHNKWIHLMALMYFIFPQIFLGLIVFYLKTLPKQSVYYLGHYLISIWLIYGLVIFWIGVFIYLFNRKQINKTSNNGMIK